MSKRIEKVNSLLEHEIGNILLRDFAFSDTLVTLTHVDTTPNLIEARVYISVMPQDRGTTILATLERGVYEVQQKLNKILFMRPIPKIIFVLDTQVAEAGRVEELLEQLKNEEK